MLCIPDISFSLLSLCLFFFSSFSTILKRSQPKRHYFKFRAWESEFCFFFFFFFAAAIHSSECCCCCTSSEFGLVHVNKMKSLWIMSNDDLSESSTVRTFPYFRMCINWLIIIVICLHIINFAKFFTISFTFIVVSLLLKQLFLHWQLTYGVTLKCLTASRWEMLTFLSFFSYFFFCGKFLHVFVY